MKRRYFGILTLAAWVIAAMAALVPSSVAASGFIYHFQDVFSGTAPASPNRPWVDAQFETVAPGRVRLTIANLNLTGNENVDEVDFNLNPALNPASLQFDFVGGSGGFKLPNAQTGEDSFKAGSSGNYDIRFAFFQGGNAANRFSAGEFVVCEIYGIPTLTDSDFAYLDTPAGGTGPFYAAAHVQRIGASSANGWLDTLGATPLSVPEPAIGSLGALAAGIWIWLARRKR